MQGSITGCSLAELWAGEPPGRAGQRERDEGRERVGERVKKREIEGERGREREQGSKVRES